MKREKDYKKMLYTLLNKMSAYEIEGEELERQYGKEYRDFYCQYEVDIYKPRVKRMLKYYPVPMVVGAVHGLFQGYRISSDAEDDLYVVADPKGNWNEPSEYSYWRDEMNPLLKDCFNSDDEKKQKAWARQAAKDFKNWIEETDLFNEEILLLRKHFEKLGRRYDLLTVFRKIGVFEKLERKHDKQTM